MQIKSITTHAILLFISATSFTFCLMFTFMPYHNMPSNNWASLKVAKIHQASFEKSKTNWQLSDMTPYVISGTDTSGEIVKTNSLQKPKLVNNTISGKYLNIKRSQFIEGWLSPEYKTSLIAQDKTDYIKTMSQVNAYKKNRHIENQILISILIVLAISVPFDIIVDKLIKK